MRTISRRLAVTDGVLLIAALLLVSASAQAQTILTVAGRSTTQQFCGDGGPATKACLVLPSDVAVDAAGNLFIADSSNGRIRKVDRTGVITTVAGNGSSGYCGGDGGPATAACLTPAGVAVDSVGNLFISSSHRVRKVNVAGTISTVAGSGVAAYCGEGGPATAACLQYPEGLAVDAAGNLFIADSFNNRVRRVSAAGIITTVAGNGTSAYCGDNGLATLACLSLPYGVALNAAGDLFIADTQNHRVRKVNTSGTITTVAGSGVVGYCGDEIPATLACLNDPERLVVDPAGNMFIGDFGNDRVRKVDLAGEMTTIAGSGAHGFCGDGGPATSACLASPRGVALDSHGGLFVADQRNARVRKVDTAFLTSSLPSVAGCLNVSGQITLGAPAPPGGTAVTLSSDNVNAMPPALVRVPAGSLVKAFAIKTTVVSSAELVTITAAGPDWTRSTAVTLTPIGPRAVTLSPAFVVGGSPVDGVVTLECAAGPGQIVVTLSSSQSAVAVPDTPGITIPPGMTTGAFTVTTAPVGKPTKASIAATANGKTASRALGVMPPP